MKSPAGRLFFAVIWLAMLGTTLSREWEEFVAQHPGASAWDFAWSLVPFVAEAVAALAVFGVLAALAIRIWPRMAKWTSPPENPPPPADAGPLYAVRTYPLHVLICVLLIGASIALYLLWPGAAVVSVGLTIAAWVWLGRRMGFGPVDDPAIPQNQSRS